MMSLLSLLVLGYALLAAIGASVFFYLNHRQRKREQAEREAALKDMRESSHE